MLGAKYTESARANWTVIPGREIQYTYNNDGKLTKETYYDTDGTTVLYAVNYTYNDAEKIIRQYCTVN